MAICILCTHRPSHKEIHYPPLRSESTCRWRGSYGHGPEVRLTGSSDGSAIGRCVSLGCHYKIPQSEWLKQQEFILSRFWRLDVQDQALAGLVSSEALYLACRWPPSPCPHVVFSVCESLLSFLIRKPILLD